MLSESGVMDLGHNWLENGWRTSHSTFTGVLTDDGSNLTGDEPGFVDAANQSFAIAPGSPCENAGIAQHPATLPDHLLRRQYLRHRRSSLRPDDGQLDLGAFEAGLIFADGFESGSLAAW